jgi:hypothetical protein
MVALVSQAVQGDLALILYAWRWLGTHTKI